MLKFCERLRVGVDVIDTVWGRIRWQVKRDRRAEGKASVYAQSLLAKVLCGATRYDILRQRGSQNKR